MSAPEPEIVGPESSMAEILVSAFADDPFMRWVFGDGIDEASPTWWSWVTAHVPPAGERWILDDGAAALWYAPQEPKPTESTEPGDDEPGPEESEETNPFVEMLRPLIGERLGEVLGMFGRIPELRPPEPHWYLQALGTRVERQGHGLGARLVRPVLDRCDEQGIGAYLESSNPRNLPFYHRLGFEPFDELWTPDRTTFMTAMWRPPR